MEYPAIGTGRWQLPTPTSRWPIKLKLKHIRQLLEGSPYPCWNSTTPSWPPTNLASSWRTQHCSRRAPKTLRTRRPGWGNPYHEPGSTIPSWVLTILLPSWQNHQRNCMGLQASQALSAAQVARSAELAARSAAPLAARSAAAAAQSAGIRGDESDSTMPSCPLAKCFLGRLRN